jgi:hypothetical protein
MIWLTRAAHIGPVAVYSMTMALHFLLELLFIADFLAFKQKNQTQKNGFPRCALPR